MTVPVFRPNPMDAHVEGSRPLAQGSYAYPWPGESPMGATGSDYTTPAQWDAYIATVKQAYAASSGFERIKLKAQLDDAEAGRQNSYRIAQLQSDTSRYGVDVGRQNTLDELKQRDKEFTANHELDLKKFGVTEGELTGVYNGQPTLAARRDQLTEAQLIAQQRSQPNRLFQTMDLEQALGSIRAGRPATSMTRTGVSAIDGLSSDYTGNPYLTGYRAPTGNGASPDTGAGQQATTAPDPRAKALRAVMDALPPSETEGLDPTGVAALNAAYHIYRAPGKVAPGSIERLGPTQQATFQSAGDRLQGTTGLSYDDFMAQYKRNAPGQQSVRAA